jgi:hypothetical protein
MVVVQVLLVLMITGGRVEEEQEQEDEDKAVVRPLGPAAIRVLGGMAAEEDERVDQWGSTGRCGIDRERVCESWC